MINGLVSVSRTYNGLLVPIAKYTLTNFLKVNVPKIATAIDFGGKPVVDDLQVDVYKTTPAIENVTAIYDSKIITAMVRYDSFIVNCHAETREDAKTWMDGFEHQMIKKNQYRGKCLYAEKDNIFFRDVPKVSWEDVILAEKIKKDIRLNTVEFLGNVKFAAAGIMKRGLVMYGPPGTGKTSVVKSIFKELEGKGVSRIYVTAESFRYMAVSRLFEFLAYLGPSVLAFEDIDMISGNRDIHTASNQLGDLLTNLDGMRKHGEPLVVIASTNKMGLLDEALANRPCRFDRRIELGLPDSIHLKAMYLKHLGQDVSDEIIHLSTSFTGSHVVETVNTAKILGANEGKSAFDCLHDACIIIRENFFPGQDMMPVKAAIQSHLIKTGAIKSFNKKASATPKSKVQKCAQEILKV
jgi:ATP-dependent 26S proteasome regulatory subunit